ncbi:O-acetyltransferase WecH [bioreactor metagenome]|uniref:O-acetyltransferase WecH n=1 Tax=bioreactor metagenome TaxID=1076179 RepID=A0A644XAY8_9ZZZZ
MQNMVAEPSAVLAVQRNGAIDILKSIAIFGVLTIHATFAGLAGSVASANWFASVFWGSIVRASVPIFLMCSGALLLDPKKELPLSVLYRKNLLRILVALFFWATAYKFYGLVVSGNGISLGNIIQSVKEVMTFQHEFHLYYLHIMILVYVCLPVTRIITAGSTKQQLRYLLAVWFVLGIVFPIAKEFWPFTLLSGIPLQWMMNMSYSAIGYGILGYYITNHTQWKTGFYLLLFFCGFLCVFGGTAAMSIRTGALYQLFWEGMSPGVCFMAAGLFGAVTVLSRNRNRRHPVAEKISKASFCVYLVHIFFLNIFTGLGFTVTLLPCLISIPILVLVVFLCSYAVYLILSRIPVVNEYLI